MSKNLWNNDIRDFFYGDNCFNKWLFSLFLDYRCNRIFWNNTLSKPVTHIWIYWNTSIKKTNVVQKLSWTISPTEFWFFCVKVISDHELPTLCWKLKAVCRLEICQKIYTTGFFSQKFYTLKVHKLQRFLRKKKQRKCINISHFSRFFVRI